MSTFLHTVTYFLHYGAKFTTESIYGIIFKKAEKGEIIMKIDRLIGIIAVLQQKRKVTATYLAKKFEVSVRTVNRDIDAICKAGIPIVTTQGRGGGISIMDGFSLDTTVFTVDELASIFVGLKSLDSISNSSSAENMARKMGVSSIASADNIIIDLSSFYKDQLAERIDILKKAIRENKLVSFRYFYKKDEADKCIEPYFIVFKWSDWYVYGFCTERQDFRMYKLRRLWDPKVTEAKFIPREISEEKKQFGAYMTDDIIITAIYDTSVKYRLVEEYGPDSFTITKDGKLCTK